MDFDESFFHGCLIKGDLPGAIAYLKQFPGQKERYYRYLSVFQDEKYPTADTDACLNGILLIYQKYYRDVFYLRIEAKQAEETMRRRFADFFSIDDPGAELSEIEEKQVAQAFRSRSLHFLGGRTAGCYGPYIWKTTEVRHYSVELPDGMEAYSVRLLDGFLSKSWLDYLSFGEIGTGGWADGDGMISCIKDSYDLSSESFRVSLLKHEAQHAQDLSKHPDMPSAQLEYRAKLVELIYSGERNLLTQFVHEADASDVKNGHAMASDRIIKEFVRESDRRADELNRMPTAEIQTIAKNLFRVSSAKINRLYIKKERMI